MTSCGSRSIALARAAVRPRRAAVVWCVLTVACSRGSGDTHARSTRDSVPAAPAIAPVVDSAHASNGDSESPTDAALRVLRDTVAREVGQPVTLDIDTERSDGRWTFVTGVARTLERRPIDYSRTKFADAVKEGMFDDGLCALLERTGATWKIVALEIGATDVPFVDWPERFGVPRELVLPSKQ
jgi:hypothetical protein